MTSRFVLSTLLAVCWASGALAQAMPSDEVIKLLEAPPTKSNAASTGEALPLNLPTVTVCAGQHPNGWAVQNVETNFTVCGGGWDNLWILVDLRGAGPGRVTSVCTFSAQNNGWTVIGTSTDFTRCGQNPGFNNISTIQKL